MKNIRISYQYDGSEFFGFQRQPGLRTVQGEIEKALKVITKENINLVSAGRTDRGVHAKEQYSNFITETKIPIEKLNKILNSLLPRDIVIKKVEEVSLDFSSRFSAAYRSYEYYITKDRNPFNSRYATYYEEDLDLEKINKILEPLIGIHDFNNFRLSDCGSNTTIREIYKVKASKVDESTIKIYIKGNAFLKSQIRIIVGITLGIYSGKLRETYLKEMLDNPTVHYGKIVAEPNGLHLSEIGY
ncbi:tRNA pseudouridine(38-40) synthase TruA [Cetobacterium sp. SF1]|uniref:tRNA pseudouridine(38-40) synthase TruA n=1 Tax=Cetobacterium sp. SF1 TaxID=3417654 RepID=UPI003CE988E3